MNMLSEIASIINEIERRLDKLENGLDERQTSLFQSVFKEDSSMHAAHTTALVNRLREIIGRAEEELQTALKSSQAQKDITVPNPREKTPWTAFEKDLVNVTVSQVSADLSKKFGRSVNAVLWAICRDAGRKKYYPSTF